MAPPRSTPGKQKKGHTVVPRVVQPHAGGIDVGATHLYAAVPPGRTAEPVRRFGTFTEDLYALAAWLQAHGVTSVAMESTGVFWIPVFRVLELCGLEVYLVNAQHVKNVPGRKTDVQDCQWLQYLHAVGLLRGSFQPPAEIVAVRQILRHRASVVQDGARSVQHMQKALTQMNLQLHHVLSDLAGVSGLAIVDAILAGERDAAALAQLREPGVRASEEVVAKALVGDYRPEQLFLLKQARAAYQFSREQLQACDVEIERELAQLRTRVDPEETPPPDARTSPGKARKGQIDLPQADLRTELYRIVGTDLTQVPGLGCSSVCALVGETGADLSAFPSAHHFASWLALCPNPKVSGGRVLRQGTRQLKQRVATLFRLAAQTQARSDNALGQLYRRLRAKLGAPAAITAVAHKLARIYYHLVTTKQAYDESIFARSEKAQRQRRLERLKREATAFGLALTPAAKT